MALKRAPHRVRRSEAAVMGDLLDCQGAGFQKAACGLDPRHLDEACRAGVKLVVEETSQAPLAQARVACQLCD
jgi:hypothetical protein